MGIYSASAVIDSGIDMNYRDNTVLESVNFTELSLLAVAETESNYNKIMKAIGVNELCYYAENGTEIVYEASGLAGFFAKVKEFFKKLIDKVKEIFHKFMAWLNSVTMDDKEFAKKYEAEIRKKWDKVKDTFTIKGYNFTNLSDNGSKINAGLSNIKTLLGESALENLESHVRSASNATANDVFKNLHKAINDESGIIDKMRAAMAKAVVGSNDNELTDSEYTKALFEGFRDGESSKGSIDKNEIEIEKCITELKTASSTQKAANAAFKEIDNSLKSTIKIIEGVEKEVNKLKELKITVDGKEEDILGSLTSYVSRVVTIGKTSREIAVTANGAYLTALKDRSRQNKAILAAVVATGKVEESSSYGSSYSESSTMGFLNDVVLK